MTPTSRRWLTSMIAEAKTAPPSLPWARGPRRASFKAKAARRADPPGRVARA